MVYQAYRINIVSSNNQWRHWGRWVRPAPGVTILDTNKTKKKTTTCIMSLEMLSTVKWTKK